MESRSFTLQDLDGFRKKALQWAAEFSSCCCFDSNHYPDPYSAFDFLIAAGVREELCPPEDSFRQLQVFLTKENRWTFGYLGYDLKNELEDLSSGNYDGLGFPNLYFFEPIHLLTIKGDQLQISSPGAQQVFDQILAISLSPDTVKSNAVIRQRIKKADYLRKVKQIKEHIRRGDIYEMNFCQEFFADDAVIDPLSVFQAVNESSPSPFAVFFKLGARYLISGTPERFLSKRGNRLISQPIKGTAKRMADPEKDQQAIQLLQSDEKERAENVMIVDLVRNDLTRCALPGTVRVEELFGIYSFPQVHQMISTVVCEVDPQKPLTELIQPLFPMGSMTGAPKLRAMQLIEHFEETKRGLYSGAAGYFSPNGDFDFNVVIRSLLYHADEKYLSFQAGSAITYDSDPEKEYEECLLKVEAIRKVLGSED